MFTSLVIESFKKWSGFVGRGDIPDGPSGGILRLSGFLVTNDAGSFGLRAEKPILWWRRLP